MLNLRHQVVFLCVMLAVNACASRRMLAVENRFLKQENAALQTQTLELMAAVPDPDKFVTQPSLQVVHRFLDQSGYVHTWNQDGNFILINFSGKNTNVSFNLQYFKTAGIVFVATNDYLKLKDVENTESVVMLLIQLAALNYDMLTGKFQLNTETGEILLSTEIHASDGLGSQTLVNAIEKLAKTADQYYPQLERAITGRGM